MVLRRRAPLVLIDAFFRRRVTLNYAHNPLVFHSLDANNKVIASTQVIPHLLLGHIDLAGSFLDRVLLSASLPVTLYQGTNTQPDVETSNLKAGVGDLRFGLMVRLFGQPEKDKVSMSLGAQVWVPFGVNDNLSGDNFVRFAPKLVIGGIANWLRWSLNISYLYRQNASIGTIAQMGGGNLAGQEIQMQAGLAYANKSRNFSIGPEAMFGTQITNGAFQQNYSSLEIMLGMQYLIKDAVLIGVAPGFGSLLSPGTPDFRMLARIAYAPVRRPPVDRDKDGVFDKDDACPDEPGLHTDNPRTNGCPERDRDHDGVLDKDDICPDVPKGEHPDPRRLGCPADDRDHDGVFDFEDICPDVPKGEHPDPERLGCPIEDRDHDGVIDREDICPDVPKGENPDPKRLGCPAVDTDKDGVYDWEDVCPTVPMGPYPDPSRKGCPLPDRDYDTVPDPLDACPDKPGAPDPDPKKNGCPGLVVVKDGKIVILEPIFFKTDKDIIMPRSFGLLKAVANVFVLKPELKKVEVQGHTDIRGKRPHNLDLSNRRALSVKRFLTSLGVSEERLDAHGYGPDKPVAPNTTNEGRSLNRRVEFLIIDPPPEQQIPAPGADQVTPIPAAAMPASETFPDAPAKGKHGAKAPRAGGHHRKKH